MRLFAILLTLTVHFSLAAQQYSTVPDSIDLVEAGDEVSLFKGELKFGKSYIHLYFAGTGADDLHLYLEDGGSFARTADKGQLNIDYLKYKDWYFEYGVRKYRVEIELVQVDWPGNEINWRMIPRVHFTEIVP